MDYITSEKYKKTELNLNDTHKFKNPAIKDLLMYYKKKNCKVYIDKTIDDNLYSQLQKYYFNENAFKKKIRIHLNIDNNILNDENKVKNIIEKIINKISEITKIPKKDLYVTNIRKNCLICDIIHIIHISRNVNDFCYYFDKLCVGELNEELINRNRIELRIFLQQIERELGNQDISDEAKYEIQKIINNVMVNQDKYFNSSYDKRRGYFGLRHFLFIPYHKDSIQKNGKTYYYPNERCEGYGLKVHCQDHFYCDDIFNPNGQWCIAYSNLSKSRISYRIRNVQADQLFDNNNIGYRLLYQCKVKKSEIINEENNNITLRNNNSNYVIPYRLIKEHIDD